MLPYGAKGRWHPEKDYGIGDIVYHWEAAPAGQPTRLYVAFADPTTPTLPAPPAPPYSYSPYADTSHWAPLNPRGIWNTGVAYVRGDVVRYNITPIAPPSLLEDWKIFIAVNNSTGTDPNSPGNTAWP